MKKLYNTRTKEYRDMSQLRPGEALPCEFVDDWKIVDVEPPTILEEAIRTIKRRGEVYGPPEKDFERTAEMLNTLFKDKLQDRKAFSTTDVARIMICIKLSRSIQGNHRDNWVDIAGYAACGNRCETGEW